MTYSKREVHDALAVRFPEADRSQLRQFIDDGCDGDIDERGLAIVVEAWADFRHYPVEETAERIVSNLTQ